jgi:hypothetical protein
MGHREVIKTGDLRVELGAVRHLKGNVIKACPQRVEGIARAVRMVAQAEQETAVLMQQQDPGDPGITGRDFEFLDQSRSPARTRTSALTLMSLTVSTMCSVD